MSRKDDEALIEAEETFSAAELMAEMRESAMPTEAVDFMRWGSAGLGAFPKMPNADSRHNCSTFLIIGFLSSRKSAYVQEVILAQWHRVRGLPNASAMARAHVATRFERDVSAHYGHLEMADPLDLAEVDWIDVADHWLRRFSDYSAIDK